MRKSLPSKPPTENNRSPAALLPARSVALNRICIIALCLLPALPCQAATNSGVAATGAGWMLAHAETFNAPGWEKNWTFNGSTNAGLNLTNQAALPVNGKGLKAQLQQKFKAPAIRVEYDAVMLGPERPWRGFGDLSCYVGPIAFRFGAENNTRSYIQGPGDFLPAELPVLITTNKTYHVVAEINGLRCRLNVDGRPCGELVLNEPVGEASVALYVAGGLARFDNFQVFIKPQPDPLPDYLLKHVAEREKHYPSQAGELRSYATSHSIGIEWDLAGDSNHNATCTAQYRSPGTEQWQPALNPLRIDWRGWYGKRQADRAYNMLAGSIMFLEPDTAYEVKLAFRDPDGGEEQRSLTIKTRAIPALPKNGRTIHATAPMGQGNIPKDVACRTLDVAREDARPGDIILVHAGKYGSFNFNKSGEPGKYIVWKAAGDGEAVFTHAEVSGSNVWIEGLVFVSPVKADGNAKNGGNALRGTGPAENVVIARNRFNGYNYSIWLAGKARAWHIADNEITGDYIGGTGGEGIELEHTSDHEVCFNRIARVADGVSYPGRNCDIYGNDMDDLTDDGIETDFGYANNRVWGNRIHRVLAHGFSFQPMFCGPWYFVQNEVFVRGCPLKPNVPDRFVLVNNTFVSDGRYSQRVADIILYSLSRNNLWIMLPSPTPEKQVAMWYADGAARQSGSLSTREYQPLPNWMTDVDYDGFDWGDLSTPFWWQIERGQFKYKEFSFEDFVKTLGIEQHAIRVYKEQIFELPDLRAYAQEPFSKKRLTLKKNCNALDAGAILPNIHAGRYAGKAPDLGACESGLPLPHYGVRDNLTGKHRR